MDGLIIVILILGFFALGLFIKNYFPSYMNEKGKNLATKEDIEEITRMTENVQQEFRQKIELYSNDVRFKYDYYYKQYADLYSNLYSFVIQSEYVRKFIGLTDNRKISFEDSPFFEITPIRKTTITYKQNSTHQSTEECPTHISKLNTKALCEYIIDNGELASQKLLKIAISYRFAYERMGDMDKIVNSVATEQQTQLLGEMIRCIVSDYNYLRSNLKLEYNEAELNNGIVMLE